MKDNKEKNLIFSPMSMHYALSAIAVGAGGKTQRQMLDALCLKEMTQAEKE